MKKMIAGVVVILALIVGFFLWHHATASNDDKFQNYELENILTEFYEDPQYYNFYDKDNKSLYAYIMSRKKEFQKNPHEVTNDIASRVESYIVQTAPMELVEIKDVDKAVQVFKDYYENPCAYILEDEAGKSMKEYVLDHQEEFQQDEKKTAADFIKKIKEVWSSRNLK